jgi:hypothetical protein
MILYIHIGTHKTGTTALQEFLFRNRIVLRKRGLQYLKTGITKEGAHHHFASSIRRTPHPIYRPEMIYETYCQKLSEEANRDVANLVSSEIFCENIQYDQIYLLKRYFRKIHVVIYLRRQDHYLESYYSQLVKGGYYNNDIGTLFQQHVKTNHVDKINKHNMNYLKLCNGWADLVGIENVVVRPYEKKQFLEGNIYSDFLNIFSIDMSSRYLIPTKDRNISLHQKELAIKRQLNNLPIEEISKRRLAVPLMELSRKRSKGDYFIKKNILSLHERQEILDYFSESNAQIAREYLGRKDGTLFYEESLSEGGESSDTLNDEDIVYYLKYILHRYPHLIPIIRDGIDSGITSNDVDISNASRTIQSGLKKSFEETSFFRLLYCRVKGYILGLLVSCKRYYDSL